ncbi:hypothetical protein B0H14DRAFT_3426572 [Mycena olivaceomarginata]|nr:hypothetical protein B0H14DRAFT_3426572 [Mycena olivaceomarginata]
MAQLLAYHRFAQLATSTDDSGNLFIPVHKNFCIVAIAAPVPLFPGHPFDPLFRSRFQVRFVNPVGAFLALCPPLSIPESELESRLRELSVLLPFPQTALQKLRILATAFPPPDADTLSSSQLGRLMVVLNPVLIYAPMQAWSVGLLDYSLASITHVTPTSATVVFTHPSGSLLDMSLAIPATGAQLHCASPTCRQATAATLAPATLLHPSCLTCHIARHDHDNLCVVVVRAYVLNDVSTFCTRLACLRSFRVYVCMEGGTGEALERHCAAGVHTEQTCPSYFPVGIYLLGKLSLVAQPQGLEILHMQDLHPFFLPPGFNLVHVAIDTAPLRCTTSAPLAFKDIDPVHVVDVLPSRSPPSAVATP